MERADRKKWLRILQTENLGIYLEISCCFPNPPSLLGYHIGMVPPRITTLARQNGS